MFDMRSLQGSDSMVELTHGGTWLKWSTLDRRDRNWALFLQSDLFAVALLIAAVLAVVSAVAWWQFSRNQDEMFNRIQNYAIGQGAAWTFAFAFLWWLLWLGRWVGPLPLSALVLIGTALLIGFWFHAVRRWA
jgi:magnesium-transporting ATPase (P-type)